MVRLSSASFRLHKVSTTLLSAAPLTVRLSREGKKRVVGALSRGGENHKLSVAELGGWGLGFGHDCLDRDAPAQCRRFHRPEPGAKARRRR